MNLLPRIGQKKDPINRLGSPVLPVAVIIWAALGVALNVGLARFTYGVMLPALRTDLGLNFLMSGFLNAAHLGGYLFGTLAAPSLGRRHGMMKLLVWSHTLVAAGALVCAVTPQTESGPVVLGFGRLVTGIGAGGGILAIMVLVFESVSARERPFVSAVVWSGIGVAIVLSAFAVPVLLDTPIGWRSAFAASAMLAIAIAVFFPRYGRHSARNRIVSNISTVRFDANQLLTGRWRFLIVSYALFGMGYGAYSTFAGAQLASIQAPTIVIEWTWATFGFSSILGAALTVPMLKAKSVKRFALVGAIACGGGGTIVVGLGSVTTEFVSAMLVGLGLAAVPTVVSALARDRCEVDEYAMAFSCVTAMFGIGQLIGPIAAGALADRFGPAAVPIFSTAAYGIAGLFAACDAIAASIGRATPHT